MVVQLPERKRAIASRLSVAPETLSRTLRAFQDAGLIEVDGYRVQIVDATRLEAIAQAVPAAAAPGTCGMAHRLAAAALAPCG